MRFHTFLLATAGAFLFAGTASATVVITDQTKDVAYHGHSPTNYFSGPSSIGDNIGAQFNTGRVAIAISGNTINLKYDTKFDGSAMDTHYADLFITPSASTGSPSSYSYGVSLGFQTTHGGVNAGVYTISAGDFATSQDIWASKTSDIYGGLYIAPNEIVQHLVPTRVTGGTLDSGWTVATQVNNIGGAYPYEVDITLTANTAAALSMFGDQYLDFLWGTGDCANDAIFAQVKMPTHVPEPASALVLAGGLLGFIRIRRKRK